MSMKTFRQALKMCDDYGKQVFIGGGEPTLHPQFEKMLLEAIATEEGAGIITNGSIKKRALLIAALHEKEALNYAALSMDEYHELDKVSDEVMRAFQGHYHSVGKFKVDAIGRAKHNDVNKRKRNYCFLDNIHIRPSGDIVNCGCEDSPIIGHVGTGIDYDELPEDNAINLCPMGGP